MDIALEPSDGYLLEVAEATELLGVSRTRLSQLTSKGILSFQRRKIGTRNRLFYRRTELLLYLRRQMGASAYQDSEPQEYDTPTLERLPRQLKGNNTTEDVEFDSTLNPEPFARHIIQTKKGRPTTLPSARSLIETQEGTQANARLGELVTALLEEVRSQREAMAELRLELLEQKKMIRTLQKPVPKTESGIKVESTLKSPSKETPRTKNKRCAALRRRTLLVAVE